jgi:hypothetical protein
MTPYDFRKLTEEQADGQLLGPCFHDDLIPFVFETEPATWDAFRTEIIMQLKVAETDIRIIGSARLGFSLKPYANLKMFNTKSDIDVVIVNADLFDWLWYALLEVAYPTPWLKEHYGGWLASRKNELYKGWLTPLEIKLDAKIFGKKAKPILEFNSRWFNALKQASRHPPRRHENVNGRLYRSWKHADIYHLNSLAELRKSLTE